MNTWMEGVPRFPCSDSHGTMTPLAGVVHDTIGSWPGDRDYVARNSLAHFTVGPEEGNWAQHAPINTILYHCNGANLKAFGVEFSAQNAGQPLTAWQKKAWGLIRAWAVTLGVPDTYLDPDQTPDASVHVNGGGFTGWISHISVKTDDGTAQHTDYVQAVDFRPVTPTPIPTTEDEEVEPFATALLDDGRLLVACRGTDNQVWYKFQNVANGQWAPSITDWTPISPSGTARTPQIVKLPGGAAHILALGTDNQGYFAYLAPGAAKFSQFVSLGGSIAS